MANFLSASSGRALPGIVAATMMMDGEGTPGERLSKRKRLEAAAGAAEAAEKAARVEEAQAEEAAEGLSSAATVGNRVCTSLVLPSPSSQRRSDPLTTPTRPVVISGSVLAPTPHPVSGAFHIVISDGLLADENLSDDDGTHCHRPIAISTSLAFRVLQAITEEEKEWKLAKKLKDEAAIQAWVSGAQPCVCLADTDRLAHAASPTSHSPTWLHLALCLNIGRVRCWYRTPPRTPDRQPAARSHAHPCLVACGEIEERSGKIEEGCLPALRLGSQASAQRQGALPPFA